jgi:hypothetical protein
MDIAVYTESKKDRHGWAGCLLFKKEARLSKNSGLKEKKRAQFSKL